MKKLLIALFILSLFIVSCESKTETEYIYLTDTIYINNINYAKIDSLIKINDSINAKLFIANYKLKRIEYYNDIAKKGNNIKYLRGWINRVLKEN